MPGEIEVHDEQPTTRVVMENALAALKESHAVLDEIEVAFGPTRSVRPPPSPPTAAKRVLHDLSVETLREAISLHARLKEMYLRL